MVIIIELFTARDARRNTKGGGSLLRRCAGIDLAKRFIHDVTAHQECAVDQGADIFCAIDRQAVATHEMRGPKVSEVVDAGNIGLSVAPFFVPWGGENRVRFGADNGIAGG